MGERKVLIHYISPDIDPSIIPRQKRDKCKQVEVRTMLPFSMRCNTCGEYMYRGKKFNSRKEMVQGEDYMGIRKFRFYIKCSVCSAEITFKTDPKNTDYECETGASRNFEIWRETGEEVEAAEQERIEEDNVDAMKALENKTLDNKLEMDVLDALDEIKAINQRHEKVDTDAVLNNMVAKKLLPSGITEEDELLVKSVQFKSNKRKVQIISIDSKVEELGEVSLFDDESIFSNSSSNNNNFFSDNKHNKPPINIAPPITNSSLDNNNNNNNNNSLGIIVKRKKIDNSINSGNIIINNNTNNNKIVNIASKSIPVVSVLGGLVVGYGESSEEEES
jgi:hypothetical protein